MRWLYTSYCAKKRLELIFFERSFNDIVSCSSSQWLSEKKKTNNNNWGWKWHWNYPVNRQRLEKAAETISERRSIICCSNRSQLERKHSRCEEKVCRLFLTDWKFRRITTLKISSCLETVDPKVQRAETEIWSVRHFTASSLRPRVRFSLVVPRLQVLLICTNFSFNYKHILYQWFSDFFQSRTLNWHIRFLLLGYSHTHCWCLSIRPQINDDRTNTCVLWCD